MFDWNDEELTNIIWDESGQSDDHIVPYPGESEEEPPNVYGDHLRKEWDLEADLKSSEQRKTDAKADLSRDSLEGSSKHGALTMDSWPNSSLSNTAKIIQDSVGKEASNNIAGISKADSARDETARDYNASEAFQTQHQDTEQGDFVDYSWATIGSFDDIDRMFSNDDQIFGDTTSLGNADELWSPSKDLTSSPDKSIPLPIDSSSLGLGSLRNSSGQFEPKEKYMTGEDQSFTSGFEKMDDVTSENVHASVDSSEYAGGKSKLLVKEKMPLELTGEAHTYKLEYDSGSIMDDESCDKESMQKRLLKGKIKSEERSEVRLQDLSGIWSPTVNKIQQFNNQYPSVTGQHSLNMAFPEQRQLQRLESSEYKHFPGPVLATPMYGNMANQYYHVPVLSQFHSPQASYQIVPSSYDVPHGDWNPLRKSKAAPAKPTTMTPQEKIEKLRRRQQMRAMLAIQKQQQQLKNPISSIEGSTMEGGNISTERNMVSLANIDPNSPLEQDDSNIIQTAVGDSSLEDTVLHQLQGIIGKLDLRVRLCIRDSLLRLAQSAAQRRYANETSSSSKSSKDDVISREKRSHSRFVEFPDLETETNPIDRTVAHLLFHRPLEFSGKLGETPESSLYAAKTSYERKRTDSASLQRGVLPAASENRQDISQTGMEIPSLFAEVDLSKNSPCFDTSENAPKIEPSSRHDDGG